MEEGAAARCVTASSTALPAPFDSSSASSANSRARAQLWLYQVVSQLAWFEARGAAPRNVLLPHMLLAGCYAPGSSELVRNVPLATPSALVQMAPAFLCLAAQAPVSGQHLPRPRCMSHLRRCSCAGPALVPLP
jgi:hypothetical protein